MKSKVKKRLINSLKIALTIALLYFVFTKINISSIRETIKQSQSIYLIPAILLFITSQVLSSFRLKLFFHADKFMISSKSNLQLYLIGMFYNFFIPGGIGGDAYKVFLLKKTFGWKTKKLLKDVLLDRLTGFIAIAVFIISMCTAIIPIDIVPALKYIALGVILVEGLLFVNWLLKKIFKTATTLYCKSLLYSIIIQSCQIISVLFILRSLTVEHCQIITYLLIFLVSSVLSILSFSGIGIREFLFLHASLALNLEPSIAVSTGLLFSFITAIVSISGLYYHFRKPQLELTTAL